MFELKRYILEKERTLPYLQENLDETNRLSSEVFHNFQLGDKGNFYTFLYETNMLDEHLYQFKRGGVGGSIKSKVTGFLMGKIQSLPGSICIFDDVSSTYEGPCTDPLFSELELHYDKEVYYYVGKNNLSKNIIEKCLYVSSSIWHSLCIISKFAIPIRQDKSITQFDIQSIVKNAEMILIGAYDDESFIFWENLRYK